MSRFWIHIYIISQKQKQGSTKLQVSIRVWQGKKSPVATDVKSRYTIQSCTQKRTTSKFHYGKTVALERETYIIFAQSEKWIPVTPGYCQQKNQHKEFWRHLYAIESGLRAFLWTMLLCGPCFCVDRALRQPASTQTCPETRPSPEKWIPISTENCKPTQNVFKQKVEGPKTIQETGWQKKQKKLTGPRFPLASTNPQTQNPTQDQSRDRRPASRPVQ